VLGGARPVIGVANTGRPGLPAQLEVMREEEAKPLLVTSAGVDIGVAKARVRAMHGRKRVPTLIAISPDKSAFPKQPAYSNQSTTLGQRKSGRRRIDPSPLRIAPSDAIDPESLEC
jgi:hypothetical protein